MNEFFTVFTSILQISLALVDSFENRKKKLVIRESETFVLNTINAMNSNFCVPRFFMFFVFQA